MQERHTDFPQMSDILGEQYLILRHYCLKTPRQVKKRDFYKMEAMIFESHAHYDDEQFERRQNETFKFYAGENGIGTIV